MNKKSQRRVIYAWFKKFYLSFGWGTIITKIYSIFHTKDSGGKRTNPGKYKELKLLIVCNDNLTMSIPHRLNRHLCFHKPDDLFSLR